MDTAYATEELNLFRRRVRERGNNYSAVREFEREKLALSF